MFRNSVLLFALLFFSTLWSCKSSIRTEEFPKRISIEELHQTDFVPTLESKFYSGKNIIYASTLLCSWDSLKKLLSAPIILSNKNSEDFRLLNESKSFSNTLNKNEYSIEEAINDSSIDIKCHFKIDLPFPDKEEIMKPIVFNNKKIRSYGMNGLDAVITAFNKILYYKNDDHFLLKILPRDTTQEIYLLKGFDEAKNFVDVIAEMQRLTAFGENEKEKPDSAWKYDFYESDTLSIPVIKFNLEKDFHSIENQEFFANHYYTMRKVFQQNAFVLNENGASIESNAEISVMYADTLEPPQKRLIFNKPFFVIIKKKHAMNPYFALRIENSEILDKIE